MKDHPYSSQAAGSSREEYGDDSEEEYGYNDINENIFRGMVYVIESSMLELHAI